MLTIAAAQTGSVQDGGLDAIEALAHAQLDEAGRRGVQLLTFCELFLTPFFANRLEEDFDRYFMAEDHPVLRRLAAKAQQHRMALVLPFAEHAAHGYFNSAHLFDEAGRCVARYRKTHIPAYFPVPGHGGTGSYEKFYFTPGDLGFTPIDTSVGRLGVLVCWDQWYPEAARLMALAGAELLLYPTAIGWDPDDQQAEKTRQRDAWVLSHRGHAVANGLPVLSCNRVGHEASPLASDKHVGASGIDFWGNSHVLGPQGEFVAEAGTDPTLLLAEVDMQRSEHVRRIWPFLRDRRIDAYGDLTKRYRD